LGDLIERKRRAKRMLAALAKAPPSETFTVNFPSSRRGSADDTTSSSSSVRRNSLGLGGSTGSLSQALAAIQSSPSNANSSTTPSAGSGLSISISKSASGKDLTTLVSPPGSDRGTRTISASRAASYLSPSATSGGNNDGSLSAARAAALTISSPPSSSTPRPRTPSITPPTAATSLASPSGSGSTSPPARSSSSSFSQARRDSRKKKAQTMPSGMGLAGLAAVLETDRPDWETRIRERIENKRNVNGTTTTTTDGSDTGAGRRKDSDDPFEALASRAPPSSIAAPPSSLAASMSSSQSFLSSSFSGGAGIGSMASVAGSVTPSYLLATSPSDNDPFGMASPPTTSSALGNALTRSRSPATNQRSNNGGGAGVSFSSSTFDPFSNSPPPTAASSLALGTSPPPLAQSPPAANMFDLFGTSPQQHFGGSSMLPSALSQQRQMSGSSAISQGYPSSSPMAMPTPNRPMTTAYYGHLPNSTASSMGSYPNNSGGMPLGSSTGNGGHGVSMFDPFFASPPLSSTMLPNSPPPNMLPPSANVAVPSGGYHTMSSPLHHYQQQQSSQYSQSPSPLYSHTPSPATPTPSPGMVPYPRATSMPIVGLNHTPTHATNNGMGVVPMQMMRTSSAPSTVVDPFSQINPFATVSHNLPPPSASPTATVTPTTTTTTPTNWQPF
jgi:hypothetical protein